ncbi:MAG TPA: exosortase H [Thermoanaerobaculia bacterium]
MRRDSRSLFFLARFGIFLVLFYFLVAWRPINNAVIEPFTAGIASISTWFLNVLGEPATAAGTEIRSASFAVNIKNGCNGIETVLLVVSAILAFPAPPRWRALGVLAGFAAIEILNLVRVISLFWIGRHHPSLFSSAHTVIWQSVIVLFGVLLFLLWAARPTPAAAHAEPLRGGRG